MIDYGGRKTDLAVKRAEGRLSLVYRQAAREIEEKEKAWIERHEKRDAKYRQMVKDGKLSKADYQAWQRGQVFQGKQWAARKAQIQETLLQADRAASRIVNEGKMGVFAANANYIGYGLEHDSGLNTGFTLYDEQTVARLIKGDPKMLPMLPPEKAVLKDKAYTYYNRLMNNAIAQGIIQGESIQEIARRIARTTGESSYKSALRNARTAYTGAQNAGRIEGLHQAQRLGIKVKKRWLAILDSKTRDSHATLDGQVQEVDDPFLSPLGLIQYPGDPNADDPADVYNCRCTLIYEYPEYPSSMQRRDAETGEVLEDMTYREWEHWKATGEMPERKPIKIVAIEPVEQREHFIDKINNLKHGGGYETAEFISVGEIIEDEVKYRLGDEYEAIKQKLDLKVQENNELREWEKREIKKIKEETRNDRAEYRRRMDELHDMEQYIRSRELWRDIIKLDKELSQYEHKKLREILRETREYGGFSENDILTRLSNKGKKFTDGMRDVHEATEVYPHSWTEHVINRGGLEIKRLRSGGRAYCINDLICTVGSLSTSIHEYGHQLERCVPGLVEAADKFYVERTKGEPLQKLYKLYPGAGYMRDEEVRTDGFIDPYMGKDYGSQDKKAKNFETELLSMGYEHLLDPQKYDRNYFSKDEEMKKWLLGMLTMVE